MPFKIKEESQRYHREYYKKNKQKIYKVQKECVLKRKDHYSEFQKKYREEHKEKAQEYRRQYYLNNKQYFFDQNVKNVKRRLFSDANFAIKLRLTDRFRTCLKEYLERGFDIKRRKAIEKLGCTIPEFKTYIESKFLDGMNWQNWKRDGWHIDHIKPLSKFDLTKEMELEKAVHFSNMQPMWAIDNIIKGSK